MENAYSLLLSGFGFVLLFLGLAGSILPVLPGPFLIWLGALLWAWGNGFERVGWPTLAVLGVLALAAWASDLFLNMVISRQAGASWKSIGGAIAGGIIGGLLLSVWIPVLGTLLGAVAGGVAGMWFVEYADKRNFRAARRAVRAYLASMALAAFLELSLAAAMIGIFVWQAFL
jgi:uncharacterized protein